MTANDPFPTGKATGKFSIPPVTLEGTLVRETEKAVLFKFLDEDEVERSEWFPFSQITEIHHGEPNSIIVSGWIYAEKQKAWGGF